MQHQVRFISVLDKVPEKVWPGQIQQGSGEGSGEGSRKPWCKAKSISTGSGEGCRAGPGEGFWESLVQGQVRTGFPVFGFAARFRPKLIFLGVFGMFFPQQCKLMGSSAHNSPGVN